MRREAGKFWPHPFDELLAIIVDDAFREPNLAKANVLVHLLSVFSIERTPTAAHLEQKYTQAPEVYKFGVSMFVEKYFRCQIFSRTTKRICEFVRPQVRFRQAEVAQGNVACGIEENILRFEIPRPRFVAQYLHGVRGNDHMTRTDTRCRTYANALARGPIPRCRNVPVLH